MLTINFKTFNKSFEKLRLYRQDGLGNYYLDPHAELKDRKDLATKENIINAGKKMSHHVAKVDDWHHKIRLIKPYFC